MVLSQSLKTIIVSRKFKWPYSSPFQSSSDTLQPGGWWLGSQYDGLSPFGVRKWVQLDA